MKKKKFYTVWHGVSPGVYDSWEECLLQVKGFNGARYKSFSSREEAEAALAGGISYSNVREYSNVKVKGYPEGPLWTVDAACSGNPGKMEYRGVSLPDKKVLFHMGPLEDGTNNIGEFLAIVHALALQKKKGLSFPVYSDSRNALLWVKLKKCRTKLKHTGKNDEIFDLISRAEKWLKENTWEISLNKWETKVWGEIPADFDRK